MADGPSHVRLHAPRPRDSPTSAGNYVCQFRRRVPWQPLRCPVSGGWTWDPSESGRGVQSSVADEIERSKKQGGVPGEVIGLKLWIEASLALADCEYYQDKYTYITMAVRRTLLPSARVLTQQTSGPSCACHTGTVASYRQTPFVQAPSSSSRRGFHARNSITATARARDLAAHCNTAPHSYHPHLTRARQYTTASTALRCPTCSEDVPLPSSSSSASSPIISHCPSCNAFLPPVSSIDYFELFDLPKQFSIDGAALKRSFLQWQGKVHPDRLPPSSDASKQEDWAKTWSAIVNEGYKTLSNESRRGEYMLLQRGVEIEEQDKMEDPELLMEILEVREALEEASTEEEVIAIRDQNKREWIGSHTSFCGDPLSCHVLLC